METGKPSSAYPQDEYATPSIHGVHSVRLYPKGVSDTSLRGGQEELARDIPCGPLAKAQVRVLDPACWN